MTQSEIKTWIQALGADERTTSLCHRDYELIWRVGTASTRKVEHRVGIVDWQSKLRGEIHFEEQPVGEKDGWETIRAHWQLYLSAKDVESVYPYLDFQALEDGSWWDDEDDGNPHLELSNGEVVSGTDAAGEYFHFVLGIKLNPLGEQLFESVLTLIKIGLLEINEEGGEFVSVAPWGARSV